jgi:selenium metabolism protein YedF
LGEVLMRSFFVALAEGPVPDTIIFLNSGVRLSTEGSPVLENLAVLAAKGVEILSCGTCLNYYQLSEKLVSGKVSNMYTIVERLAAAGRTINW